MVAEQQIVRYFVPVDGNIQLEQPPAWLETKSNATTVEGLKRDLVGEVAVPRKFHVLFLADGAWRTERRVGQHLPGGTLSVQVVPLGSKGGKRNVAHAMPSGVAWLIQGCYTRRLTACHAC